MCILRTENATAIIFFLIQLYESPILRQSVKGFQILKLAIRLSFLAFQHVCALLRELFCEIANQSLFTSHNIANFVHLWFCEKLDEKLSLSSFLTFRENTDHLARTAKREKRKMIDEIVYEMPSIHFSFLLFRQHFFAYSSIWR